jgi:hypothetical protein
MKTVIILLLILSTLILGCAKQTAESPAQKVTQTSEAVSDQEAINEVDNSLLSENDDIGIGDMI